MDDLQKFLEMGGKMHLGMQQGKYLLSISYEHKGQNYGKGVYFKNQDQLCAYLAKDGDFVLASLNGIKKRKVATTNES